MHVMLICHGGSLLSHCRLHRGLQRLTKCHLHRHSRDMLLDGLLGNDTLAYENINHVL